MGIIEIVMRKTSKVCITSLDVLDFIKRYLLHVLPSGFMKVRYYGFMHPAFNFDYEELRVIVEGLTSVLNKKDPEIETVPVPEGQSADETDIPSPLDQGLANIIPEEEPPSQDFNKGPERAQDVTGERYIIHISARKTKKYALSLNKKIMRLYPDTIIIFENDRYIIMIPNLASREEARTIVTKLTNNLDVSPLIYRQRRNISDGRVLP